MNFFSFINTNETTSKNPTNFSRGSMSDRKKDKIIRKLDVVESVMDDLEDF